jgi:hypothetical protein
MASAKAGFLGLSPALHKIIPWIDVLLFILCDTKVQLYSLFTNHKLAYGIAGSARLFRGSQISAFLPQVRGSAGLLPLLRPIVTQTENGGVASQDSRKTTLVGEFESRNGACRSSIAILFRKLFLAIFTDMTLARPRLRPAKGEKILIKIQRAKEALRKNSY